MKEKTGLIVFTGVKGNSEPEELLNGGLEANTLDLLGETGSVSAIDERVLVTNSDRLRELESSAFPELTVVETGRDFHFGERLHEVIEGFGFDRVLYAGGGSAPLLSEADFRGLVEFLESRSGVSISNNFYSTDLIGISPAGSLLELERPEADNELGWMTRESGLTPYELERTAGSQLDLDSPLDLLPLKLSTGSGPELTEYVSALDWGETEIRGILEQLTDQDSRLVVLGRIGAKTLSYLEENAACHVDAYSEGRGSYSMVSSDGLVPSLGGNLLEERGPEGLIDLLTDQGTGLLLDTRVLFDYLGEWPERKDRFSSDLLQPEGIDPPYLRRLTWAAREAAEPVVLGGHSILSGGLLLLTDLSWRTSEPTSANVRPKTYEL